MRGEAGEANKSHMTKSPEVDSYRFNLKASRKSCSMIGFIF